MGGLVPQEDCAWFSFQPHDGGPLHQDLRLHSGLVQGCNGSGHVLLTLGIVVTG